MRVLKTINTCGQQIFLLNVQQTWLAGKMIINTSRFNLHPNQKA